MPTNQLEVKILMYLKSSNSLITDDTPYSMIETLFDDKYHELKEYKAYVGFVEGLTAEL